jgi:hypothetical protein
MPKFSSLLKIVVIPVALSGLDACALIGDTRQQIKFAAVELSCAGSAYDSEITARERLMHNYPDTQRKDIKTLLTTDRCAVVVVEKSNIQVEPSIN